MDRGEKLAVLRDMAHRLNAAHITWALGSSGLAWCKGAVEDFHDFDLLITSEDTLRAKAIFDGRGTFCPSLPHPRYCSDHFLEYLVDGAEFDLIGGFAIREGDIIHRCDLTPDQIVEFYDLQGEPIPLQSLSLWETYYTWMQRPEKALRIHEFLNK